MGCSCGQTPQVGRSVRQALRRPWQLPAYMGFTWGGRAEVHTPSLQASSAPLDGVTLHRAQRPSFQAPRGVCAGRASFLAERT